MLNPHFHLLFLLLLLSAATSTALTQPSDVAALKAFKESINPASIPSWSCLASWDFSSADPCSLPRRTHFLCGLSCDPSGRRITSLTLDSVGYSGTLSPLLSRLTNLAVLDLSDNSFHGPIPFDSLSSLRALQTLSLAGNSFSGALSPSISTLKSLEEIDLSRNFLSGPIPVDAFSSLSSLQRIDLSLNKFTGSVPKIPPNLIEFTIRSNSLSGPVPQTSFSGSVRLEVVDLSGNSLSGSLPAWFFNLPSLQQINLSNNTLTRVDIPKPSGEIGGALVAVDLGFNKIDGYVPVNFASYPSLAALSLRHNRLRGQIPWQYGNQGTLTRLFLDGNYLIGKPPADFFSGKGAVISGSLGDNCLQGCPPSSELCLPSQKPMDLCKKVYRGRPRS